MLKNNKLLQLSVVCAGLVFAANIQASSRDGVYLGAGIGAIADKYDLTTKNLTTGFSVKSPVSDEKNALANVFLGYGSTADSGLYLAGELGSNFSGRSTTISNRRGVALTTLTFADKLQVQDYATFDLLPGYRFNEDWLLYGRAGLTYSHFSLRESATALTPAFNVSENKAGGRLGAGINFAFNNNWGMGVDYIYTRYTEMNAKAALYNVSFNQKLSSNYLGLSTFYTIE